MPRKSRETDLSTPTARRRLKPRTNRAPYYRSLGDGRFLGYRKAATGPGTWTARAYSGEGKYKEASLGAADDHTVADGESVLDYRQALDAAADWCRAALTPPGQEPTEFTLGKAMASYLEWYKAHRKPTGYESAKLAIQCHILPAFGADTVLPPLDPLPAPTEDRPYRFTAPDIRRWHQELATAPAKLRAGKSGSKTRPAPQTQEELRQRKATANRILTYFKAALNFNAAEGLIPKSLEHLWAVRPFRKVDKPRIRHFDSEETARLLNSCQPDFRALVTGALLTGGRYGGLTAMLVRDFSLDGGYVRLTEKSEGEEGRLVYLNDEGVNFFAALAAGRNPNERMFLRADGTPWGRSHQTRPMAEAAKLAKLEPPNNFHILRHTYASLYLMNGGSLEGLSEQLGHGDTRMTKRNYAHLAERWRSQEAKAYAPRFGLPAPTNVRPFRGSAAAD